jgi:hypothetical protein
MEGGVLRAGYSSEAVLQECRELELGLVNTIIGRKSEVGYNEDDWEKVRHRWCRRLLGEGVETHFII